ncbi:MAG TPA: hypothetical protein VGF89_00965 [Steroidobacteraceae bacterium]|jgi:uncharacterized phiE125 gp8 family phage protein
MPLKLTTPPAQEPVSVEDFRANSRLESASGDDEPLLQRLITAARVRVENYCNRSLITQEWLLTLDAFPGAQTVGSQMIQAPYNLPDNAVLLERGPIQSVDQIAYTDMGSNSQVTDPSIYTAELSGDVGRITPVFGQIWPITLPQIGAVRIGFTAGYGDAADMVPGPIIQAILMLCEHLYGNRGVVAASSLKELPWGVAALLDDYQVQLN